MAPENVSAMVGWLCHKDCTAAASIHEAGAGYFAQLRFQRSAPLFATEVTMAMTMTMTMTMTMMAMERPAIPPLILARHHAVQCSPMGVHPTRLHACASVHG